MTPQPCTDIYQRRDALLAQLNYANDDEEADELKQQIEALNQELTDQEPESTITKQVWLIVPHYKPLEIDTLVRVVSDKSKV